MRRVMRAAAAALTSAAGSASGLFAAPAAPAPPPGASSMTAPVLRDAVVAGASDTTDSPAGATAPRALKRHPRGLSLAGLEALAPGGRAAHAASTTAQVKELVVSATRAERRSFAEILAARPGGEALVGAANVFLSHTYGDCFFDVLDAARAWETAQPPGSGPFFYYFDLSVGNQHTEEEKVSFEKLRDEFGESVAAIGRTLLVLRWAEKTALSRAWCIFEVATTLMKKKRLEIVMPPSDAAALCAALVGDFHSVEQRLCAIDTAEAEATVQSNLVDIRKMINDEEVGLGGFGPVNELVLRELRKWVLSAAEAELARTGAALAEDLEVRLGDFLRSMGRTEDAEAHLRLALVRREALLEAAPSSRERALSVAAALSSLGSAVRLADGSSVDLLRRALDMQEAHLAPDDSALITTAGRLAVALKDASRLVEARPLYERVLGQRRASLGDDHPDTIFSHMNLAMLHYAMRNFPAHNDIVSDVLVRRRRLFGERHPPTLYARHRYALKLQNEGALAEAEEELVKVCNLQREVCGWAHKETLASRSRLAAIWHTTGRSTEARREYEDVRDTLERKYGAAHADTIRATEELASVLVDVDAAAACREYVRALKGVRKNVGGRKRFKHLPERAKEAKERLGASAGDLALKAELDAALCAAGIERG